MTRIDSVRHAAGQTKDSMQHAAEVVAPYAVTAKDSAAHYADEARHWLTPRVATAAQKAHSALPPKVAAAVDTAAVKTALTARQATDYAAPRVGQAVVVTRAAAGPARDEALARGAAALAALQGRVSIAEIDKLNRKYERRCRAGKAVKRFAVLALIGGAGFAAWKWWAKQTNPDWLVEPAPPTGVADRATLNGSGPTISGIDRLDKVDGSPVEPLDPEVQAKQAEADDKERQERGDTPA
ncbi:DUF5324 family protein [Streptomyces sp. H10-C2]|uniref:DUF5324 family protein n=1 Tax=unclassified Streptomyces TaxID=2593676 RepID=UPI0024BB6140|nr:MULTISPECIES: DUF5324 family protein [unclassified Streptomyces]MDJ0340237.1 DUF5324 family protein [Streptomyces sp. PH10-H1]MDJ0368314.1 DUF5324 family protein [Streptomyces sp. H10-C2]